MIFSWLRFRDAVSGPEIFRVASLFLYVTLLLHVAAVAMLRHLTPQVRSLTAVALLLLLLLIAARRLAQPERVAYERAPILLELGCVIAAISLLTLQPTIPVLALMWLVGAAGIFPLVLNTGLALGAVGMIALAGIILSARLGVPVRAALPGVFVTLFTGLLAILLANAFRMNLAAIRRARLEQRRFDAVARVTRHVIVITDANFKVKYVNPAMFDVFGYTVGEIESGAVRAQIHPDDRQQYRGMLENLLHQPGGMIFSCHRTRHKDGRWIWIEARAYNLLRDAAIEGLVFSIEDVSARMEAERKLKEEHTLLRAVLELNPSMIYAKDAQGRFTIGNSSFLQRRGYVSEEQLRGKTALEMVRMQQAQGLQFDTEEYAGKMHSQDMRVIQTGVPLEEQEFQGLREGDAGRWYRTSKFPLHDAGGAATGVLGITRDITESKEYEIRLEHQALHDPLTGLPNRRYLVQKLADLMRRPDGRKARLAMLFCDIDFFKNVNNIHGHEVGDQCLMEITRRIRAELAPADFAARFGGDEFVVLTDATVAEAEAKANAMLHALSRPLAVADALVKLHASIGIAQLSSAHANPLDLVRDADAAMFQAKERGRNRVALFDASLQRRTTKRAQMDGALRFALERNELSLVYQPKVSLRDGTLKGFEQLMRWNSPQYGEISPEEFIPIAESSGLVVPIGLWALEQACHQLCEWRQRHEAARGLTVAVNVSMRQLLQTSFKADVATILKRSGIDPAGIELELTETSAMANPQQSIDTLSQLKELGLRIALDDFGTGYSSLAYLQKLPIDVIKIDKTFVPALGSNHGDTAIVRLIMALAHTLSLETVAEGIESAAQREELTRLGCDLGQGYVFSTPLSATDAETLIQARTRFLAA
jgi:diguanylate cyclase (GGDEF)-like protein/PAS domain S-box-containing protein